MKVLDTLRNMLRLFRRAFGGYMGYIVIMAVLSFLGGTLEGIGITAVIPLFSVIVGGEASDGISRAIANLFGYLHLPLTAKFLIVFMVVLFLAKAVFLFFSQQITSKIMADFEKKMRSRLLSLTFAARWPFLSSQKVGHLDQMLTTEVAASSSVLYYVSSVGLVATNLIVYSIIVFNISAVVALFAVVLGTIIFFVFIPLLRRTKIISIDMVRENKHLAHYASEHVIGAKTIKAMGLEEPALKKGAVLLTMMQKLYLKTSFLRNISAALIQLSGVFFIIGLFAFLYKTSAFQFASFAVVVYALNKVITNVQYAQNQAHVISSQIPYLESIFRYEDDALGNREYDTGAAPFLFSKEIVFSDVCFSYRADEPALSSVNLSIQKGESIGLIGPSGSGKTTIVDMLLRLIHPDKGDVLLDGKEITQISLREWRNHIGYMSQDVFLLNDSIESNIKFYNASITDDDMVAAAKMANIYKFIKDQPEGFNTQVGERGLALSGGQRQRIALARVLARKPELLILDEATSALDGESEAMIQKSLDGLKGALTVVVIAHRLSTVMNSDRLFVLERGTIVEEGAPEVLLTKKGSRFSALHSLGK